MGVVVKNSLSLVMYHPGPPRVSERVAHRQSIRIGRTMKLPCPVEGDPPPLIMWTKDGRNIHSGWTRFRVLQNGLRIKEVETDDAGTYICKAINGFGSVNINYTLIIIGKCLIVKILGAFSFSWLGQTADFGVFSLVQINITDVGNHFYGLSDQLQEMVFVNRRRKGGGVGSQVC